MFGKLQAIYLLSVFLFFSMACTCKKKVDVSKINLHIKIERFDHSLEKLDTSHMTQSITQLKKQYGAFYDDFMMNMLGVGNTGDTSYYKSLREVLKNKDYQELNASVKAAFPNLKDAELHLTDSFKHVKYYFPNIKLPRIIAFFSGFTVQVPIGNDYLGIGLDMFLGSEGAKYYPALVGSIPLYISRRFTPENITPRVMETFIREDLFPERDDNKNLLSKMIYNGIVMHMMDLFIPNLSDSLKIGYTKKQLEWCKKYQADIWGYFLQENLLYETDYTKIQKYLTEAPFTPGIGERSESAPKLGIWIGWQIVKKYMEENQEVSLHQLIQENDFQKILNKSQYRP